MQYARDHPGETPTEEHRERRSKHVGGEMDKSEERGAKFLRVPPLPMAWMKAMKLAIRHPRHQVKVPSTSSRPEEMVDDSRTNEPKAKVPRVESPEGSPTHLYAPHYAGNVNKVTEDSHPVNEEQWETEIEEYVNDEPEMDWTMVRLEAVDEGQPPQVDPETMKEIEAAAGQEEISRLLEMGVIREPTTLKLEQGEILTTRSVYDWRVRGGQWKRRCRFVAREFKGNDISTAKTFAPTSSLAATRLVLGTHVILKWHLCFLDIKDAFLLVDQTRLVLVEQR